MSRLVAKVVGPHRFAAYRWLVPVGVPHPSGWHYGLRRGQGPSSPVYRGSMRVDPETLDADLRELVTGLHRIGVATLPSCQGHFGWCAERIKQAARDVAGQESLIHRGLVMRDIEDGSRMMVRRPVLAGSKCEAGLPRVSRALRVSGIWGLSLPLPGWSAVWFPSLA